MIVEFAEDSGSGAKKNFKKVDFEIAVPQHDAGKMCVFGIVWLWVRRLIFPMKPAVLPKRLRATRIEALGGLWEI